MDPRMSSKDTPPQKSETVKIESSDSNSSLETDRSLTGCDTKLRHRTNDDSKLCSRESDNPIKEDAKKSENSDDFPGVSEQRKNDSDEESSSITVMEKSAREAWLDKIGIRGNIAPKFPHYSELKDRLKSYSFWTSQNQQPNMLSEAGFFFIGIQDRTACFHCGGGLREWKSTDDPWIEHAHWFPKCNFVLNVKGQEFIDQAWRNKLTTTTSKELKNAADVLKELFDVIGPKLKNDFQKERINLPKYTDSKVVASEKESLFTCQICFAEERNVMFLPCHHVVSCSKCSSLIKNCAICRATIEGRIRAIYA